MTVVLKTEGSTMAESRARQCRGAESRCHGWQQHEAFTLTELLVVVGIILVLAGLLSPSLSRAIHGARNVRCLNNVRQLGLGLGNFVNENRVYPLYRNDGFWNGTNPEHGPNWEWAVHTQISGPISKLKVFKPTGRWWDSVSPVWACPAGKKPRNFPSGSAYPGYGYNAFGLDTSNVTQPCGLGASTENPSSGIRPVSDSEIISPSGLIALADGFRGGNGVIADGLDGVGRTGSNKNIHGDSTTRARQRHSGKANVFFCDGHTESISLNTLFTDLREPALSLWNRDNEPHGRLARLQE